MRVHIALKIVLRASAVLVLSASLANALAAGGQQVDNRENASVNQRDIDDKPLSPRLAALQDRLKAGDRTALDEFWTEIRERGTPMIEPATDSDREMLVTMLWRATEET